MTRKVITLEFVVPTALAIALAIMLSIGAVYLSEIYLGPIEQAEAHHSAAVRFRAFSVARSPSLRNTARG
jgi:hypothetical protein